MKQNFLKQRLGMVRERLDSSGAQGILIGSASNRRWLSGFEGSYGWLLVTHDQALLATDFRYWEQAQSQAPHFEMFKLTRDRKRQDLILAARVQDVAIEAQHLSVYDYQSLQEIEGINWLPRENMIEELRAVKDSGELELIRAAAAITDATMQRVHDLLKPGMTESELAWELEKEMRESGATGMTFPVSVSSGPNSALPHHAPGKRRIQEGDVLLVDMGASYAGYGSDLSRTFLVGSKGDSRFEEIYRVVTAAKREAIRGISPGLTGSEIDAIARDMIVDAGYGDRFGHGLGHGVGLDGHEAPRLSTSGSDTPLVQGMVTTVEPGIYLPGWGGVRMEDLVLITESGAERLSHCPEQPVIAI